MAQELLTQILKLLEEKEIFDKKFYGSDLKTVFYSYTEWI